MKKTRTIQKHNRHVRIRKKIFGTSSRPRLSVYRSNTSFFVQIIDDTVGKTLIGMKSKGKNKEIAKIFGNKFGQRAKEIGISSVVFDRGGHAYHGSIQSFADGVREEGIIF